jgi:hypothetical protein
MKCLFILLSGFAFTCTLKASPIAEVIIEGLPVKVISTDRTYKVYEQYPWEGRSSKYGPKGNRLGADHGVGVGKNIAHALQLRLGDWVHIPGIGWRQVNESSTKRNAIEFYAAYRNEYKKEHPRVTIDRVVFALPPKGNATQLSSSPTVAAPEQKLAALR